MSGRPCRPAEAKSTSKKRGSNVRSVVFSREQMRVHLEPACGGARLDLTHDRRAVGRALVIQLGGSKRFDRHSGCALAMHPARYPPPRPGQKPRPRRPYRSLNCCAASIDYILRGECAQRARGVAPCCQQTSNPRDAGLQHCRSVPFAVALQRRPSLPDLEGPSVRAVVIMAKS